MMKDTRRGSTPGRVRDALLKRGGPNKSGFVRHAYRPFDNRWLYWEAETKLLDEKARRLQAACVQREICGWLPTQQQRTARVATEPQVCFTQHIGDIGI